MASGVRHVVDLYLDEAVNTDCGQTEFAVAGQYVKLDGDCGVRMSMLATAATRPVWYDYARQTVGAVAPLSNGILFRAADSIAVGGGACTLSPTVSKHTLPEGLDSLWATAKTAAGELLWEGLLDGDDASVGPQCEISLFALRGTVGYTSAGEKLMLLPQTEMQGMLALVCAVVAAVYLVGSASFYEGKGRVREVHNESKSTRLFLVDGPLTAVTAVIAALMIGSPEQQMPWVVYQRAVLCAGTVALFVAAIYLLYTDSGGNARATTLRTVVELPLLVAVYSPLASSASGVVDLAALLLGVGTILIAMRAPPVAIAEDWFDAGAKAIAVLVQAPALLVGVITQVDGDGVAQALSALALSLGICAASLHASGSYPQSTEQRLD